MLTVDNLCRYEFITRMASSDGTPIKGTEQGHILLYNETRISIDDVVALVDSGMWRESDLVVEVTKSQLNNLHDFGTSPAEIKASSDLNESEPTTDDKLFKWRIRLGTESYNQVIADGYVYAVDEEDAKIKLKRIYTNVYETVIIDGDYEFDDEDNENLLRDDLRRIGKVIIRWED